MSMTHDQKARLLHQIGATLKADRRFSRLGTLFICSLGDGFMSMSLFWDRGNYIAHAIPDFDKFEDDMIELWELDAHDQRWLEIQYLLKGNNPRSTCCMKKILAKNFSTPGGFTTLRNAISATSAWCIRHGGTVQPPDCKSPRPHIPIDLPPPPPTLFSQPQENTP